MSPSDISPDLQWLLGATIILYVVAMYGLSVVAQRRIKNTEDFLLAGRRLPLSLAWATLLATWFGAGTLLTATDEVRSQGVERAALDPFGAGFCLILAGLLFAKPLWEMKLTTLCDFFRRRFGPRAELLSALIMVPGYFGWIAAQFVALAGVLQLFFGLDPILGILIVALVSMGYTLMGGMWSVTLTDALQISLVLVGLVVLTLTVLASLGQGSVGAGLSRLYSQTPEAMLQPIPTASLSKLVGWLGVFAIGALGNIPGQDLMQRIFASKSSTVARRACYLAGGAYLTFGLLPITLGLAARLLFPEDTGKAILPALAHAFLSPTMAVIFTVTLLSAVLSTIDSAILSPASVLAQNVFSRLPTPNLSSLALNRLAVVLVTAASILMALMGESAYELLENAYLLGLVGLFVPLALGLYMKARGEQAAMASMVAGMGLWLSHYLAGWESLLEPWTSLEIPIGLAATAASLAGYLIGGRLEAGREEREEVRRAQSQR